MSRDQYGGFLRRLFASTVDDIVLHLAAFAALLFIAVVAVFAGVISVDDIEIDDDTAENFLLSYYAMFVSMNAFYYTWFHGTTGQTLGKKLFGLRVLKADGSPVGLGTAFLRWVGYLVSGIPFFLGFLWVIIDRKRQGWHDKIAGTIVINVKKYGMFQQEDTPKYALTNMGVFYK